MGACGNTQLRVNARPVIERFPWELAHGITLSCRAAGERGQPVMLFLHGFPEAAFIWDGMLEHFAASGYRCIAPNLRGFERSTQPPEAAQYRARFLVQDIAALIEAVGAPIDCLVAHDWGGAVAWNLANQFPHLTRSLAILNSPHPATFLRELKHNPRQQAASAYMNFLIRAESEKLLREDDYRRLFSFLDPSGSAAWLTVDLRRQYREVWDISLEGGCNYYRASPLRPPSTKDRGADGIDLPREMCTINIPTLVIWGMRDHALGPELLDGLGDYVSDLTIERLEAASHWVIHEQPEVVAQAITRFLDAARWAKR